MLSNVTIIIPAHNRPERLRRLIDYYKGSGAQLLIPDSSNRAYTGPTDDPCITYRHFPRMHFLLKLREVMPLISTRYVLYCADDDFAVPSGIKTMTDFLAANPDYSVAQGHYLTFTPRPDGRIDFYPRYIRNFDSRICAPDPIERLQSQKGIYASMLYGTTRTDLFRLIYSYCFDSQGELRFRNLFLAEEFFNHAMLIQGCYATLPAFYSAREQISGSATETTTPIAQVRETEEYEGYLTALALMLADSTGLSEREARQCIRAVCDSPRDSAPITLKRRIVTTVGRQPLLRPLSRLLAWRYNQKGLRAVSGMPSYPCTSSSPDRDAIVRAIRSTARRS